MDRVRFGRALGYGARHAAKSLAAAVDAATTPNPNAPAARPAPVAAPPAQAAPPTARPAATAPRSAANPQRAAQVISAGRQASRSVLAPVKKATSVVMLQVTGSFFGLLAFGMGRGLWKLREGFHAPVFSQAWMTVWVMAAIVAGLSYFCVSNFVRASLRERS